MVVASFSKFKEMFLSALVAQFYCNCYSDLGIEDPMDVRITPCKFWMVEVGILDGI
jgi:hypothetical protein